MAESKRYLIQELPFCRDLVNIVAEYANWPAKADVDRKYMLMVELKDGVSLKGYVSIRPQPSDIRAYHRHHKYTRGRKYLPRLCEVVLDLQQHLRGHLGFDHNEFEACQPFGQEDREIKASWRYAMGWRLSV